MGVTGLLLCVGNEVWRFDGYDNQVEFCVNDTIELF
jgi:hypothetical protein